MTKPVERELARELRRGGEPIKRIAAQLGVSPSSVHGWTRDIVLTPEQRARNARGPRGPQSPARVAARAEANRSLARERRLRYQEEGRARAREGDPLHLAGCMLYWAEGAKGRNSINFANSDEAMVRRFVEFLLISLGVAPGEINFRLNVYTNNGLRIEEIENHWLDVLGLPRSCLRGHQINHYPTSSSGRRKHRLPYGVCTIRVHDTRLVQHLYGAIGEYAGFEEPRWLDGGSQRGAS